jgi:chitin synthase
VYPIFIIYFFWSLGTLVLPAAITFTGVLIASTFMSDPQWIPLFLLAAILGLPALLILFTARHPVYVVWFLIYFLALPVWNFVLPVYAYWHMDDFSWGETRKVDGAAGDDHGKPEGTFDASHIFMKRWHEFEMERLKKAERYGTGNSNQRESGTDNESEFGSGHDSNNEVAS